MAEADTPATGGVTTDPIKLGTILYTLVEPHRGHEVAYNRWYERDHFYAGCMIGAYNFAGGRFVATHDLKALRVPGKDDPSGPSPIVADPEIGSYVAIYYVLAEHTKEWNRWAVNQVKALHASGRMFAERDHIHTCLYTYDWEHRRSEDDVPAELTLDHPFGGVVSVFGEVAEGADRAAVDRWLRDDYLPDVLPGSPVANVLSFTPIPLLGDAPGDVPRQEAGAERFLQLWFVEGSPTDAWDKTFAGLSDAFASSGVAKLLWASPFKPTIPGTDTYTDQLWA